MYNLRYRYSNPFNTKRRKTNRRKTNRRKKSRRKTNRRKTKSRVKNYRGAGPIRTNKERMPRTNYGQNPSQKIAKQQREAKKEAEEQAKKEEEERKYSGLTPSEQRDINQQFDKEWSEALKKEEEEEEEKRKSKKQKTSTLVVPVALERNNQTLTDEKETAYQNEKQDILQNWETDSMSKPLFDAEVAALNLKYGTSWLPY